MRHRRRFLSDGKRMEHVKLDKISMKGSPLTERWVQELLTNDPTLLGLGDLDVRETERPQLRAGRLDMLLTDPESSTRYEVELQLGATDESHIIRTIEYWDNERRRYPQYEHVAVIVAEEITSRFFNVISLFNGFIPLVAIQMTALRLDDASVSLVFTRVLDHVTLGTDEEDKAATTDRSYWEKLSSAGCMRVVDRLHSLITEEDPEVRLSYKKHFIGLARDGIANNYVSMQPRKKWVIINFRIPRSDEISDKIDASDVSTLSYDRYFRQYRVKIFNVDEVGHHRDLLSALIATARAEREPN